MSCFVVVVVVVVIVVVVMFLPTYFIFYTGCIQEAGEGTSPLLSFLHPFAVI